MECAADSFFTILFPPHSVARKNALSFANSSPKQQFTCQSRRDESAAAEFVNDPGI